MITKNTTVEFSLTEKEIANEIWEMDCLQQSMLLYYLSQKFKGVNGVIQLASIQAEITKLDLEKQSEVYDLINRIYQYLGEK
jgi:hypothetical protein